MRGVSSFGPVPLLLQRPDMPLPKGAVSARTAPVVAVAAQPWHPSNAVLVELRRQGGRATVLRAIPERAAPEEGQQWFRAVLPHPGEGGRLAVTPQVAE